MSIPRLLPNVSLKHPEVRGPGTDGFSVRARHRPRDLSYVRQVVYHPGGKQLTHRHRAQLRMLASQLEIVLLQIPAPQRCHVSRSEAIKFLQQVFQRSLGFQFGETIEWIESAIRPLLQDDPRARDPVGSLAVYQVPDDLSRTPGIRALIDSGPILRQLVEQRGESCRRPLQNRNRFIEIEVHLSSSSDNWRHS